MAEGRALRIDKADAHPSPKIAAVSVLGFFDLSSPPASSSPASPSSAKLGPEYVALVGGLEEMDPNSKDSKEVNSTLDGLDKLCPQ